MNKKTTITNLVGMKQEVEFTELEQELIGVIDNFILWNTTESDIGLAEEYMANEHVDYNEFFKIDKSKYNSEDRSWEGSNKFWHAWNSPFVKIISGEIANTLENRKEARDWLRSRASGFSDDDGILDRESVLRLVKVYGKKNASVPGGDPGFPEAPWFWGAYLSKNSVAKKEMLAKQASGRMAERAGKTLNGMIEESLNIGTGSDLLSDTII